MEFMEIIKDFIEIYLAGFKLLAGQFRLLLDDLTETIELIVVLLAYPYILLAAIFYYIVVTLADLAARQGFPQNPSTPTDTSLKQDAGNRNNSSDGPREHSDGDNIC